MMARGGWAPERGGVVGWGCRRVVDGTPARGGVGWGRRARWRQTPARGGWDSGPRAGAGHARRHRRHHSPAGASAPAPRRMSLPGSRTGRRDPSGRTRARPGREDQTDRRRWPTPTQGPARTRLPNGPCSPTLPRSANSRSRPEVAAPRHIRGDPRAGSVRAERPSAGHRCPVLSLMVALRGEVRASRSADLPPFSTVPRSRRLGNHSRPPDAPELRASEQGP